MAGPATNMVRQLHMTQHARMSRFNVTFLVISTGTSAALNLAFTFVSVIELQCAAMAGASGI